MAPEAAASPSRAHVCAGLVHRGDLAIAIATSTDLTPHTGAREGPGSGFSASRGRTPGSSERCAPGTCGR